MNYETSNLIIRRTQTPNGYVYHVGEENITVINEIDNLETRGETRACVMGYLKGKGWNHHDANREWNRLWRHMFEVEQVIKEDQDNAEEKLDNGLGGRNGTGVEASAAEDRASGDGPCREDGEEQSAETETAEGKTQAAKTAKKIAHLMRFSGRYLVLDHEDLDFIRSDSLLQVAINYACYLSLDREKPFVVVDTEYASVKRAQLTYPEIQGCAVAGIFIPNNFAPSDENIDKLALVQDYLLNASNEGHPYILGRSMPLSPGNGLPGHPLSALSRLRRRPLKAQRKCSGRTLSIPKCTSRSPQISPPMIPTWRCSGSGNQRTRARSCGRSTSKILKVRSARSWIQSATSWRRRGSMEGRFVRC